MSYVPLRQLYLQAVIAGITEEIVADGCKLLHERKRTFTHGAAKTPSDDPLLLRTIGELKATAFTLKTLILEAAKSIDNALSHKNNKELYHQYQHEAALQAAHVKIIGEKLALQAATNLFDIGGASATRKDLQLDRHWRNIRTIASHNPSSYKEKDIGNYLVNDKPLPLNGYY